MRQVNPTRLVGLLDRPIAFHCCFVDLTGSVTAAVMLSQALYWQQRTKHQEGWWYKTREEWQEETGMTRYEQENARQKLQKMGVLQEERRGMPAQLWYRVDEERLLELLTNPRPPAGSGPFPVGGKPTNWMAGNQPTRWRETNQQDGGKLTNKMAGFPPSTPFNTEITSEITTETTTTTPNPSSSTEEAATTEPARGGRGDEEQNPDPKDGDQEPVALETTKQNPVSREEVEAVATTEASSDTPIENPNPVASEEASDEQQPELVFPAKLTEAEYADMAAQVDPLPLQIAQQMLDVIEAKRQAGQIKTTPAAVLRGIVRKHQADSASFDPSIGFAVADVRRRRAEAAHAEALARTQARVAQQTRPISEEARHTGRQALQGMLANLRGHHPRDG